MKRSQSEKAAYYWCSVAQSCLTLWPHGLQHARLPCPSLSSRACPNLCPLSQWCHPTILSSVIPFSSCLQSFPASGSFPMSQFFASGGQSAGVSASASVFPMNIQDWSPLGLTGLISLQSNGLSRVFSNTIVRKHQFFFASTVKGFGIVNKAELDVFLELSCFFYDPMDVGDLISCSSAFSKSSLNIWKFSVHGLLKPHLDNFEHYFAGMWDECNCGVLWIIFGIAILYNFCENGPLSVLWPLLSFPNLLAYWVQHFNSYTLGFQLYNTWGKVKLQSQEKDRWLARGERWSTEEF